MADTEVLFPELLQTCESKLAVNKKGSLFNKA